MTENNDDDIYDVLLSIDHEAIDCVLAQKSLDDYARKLLEFEPARHHRFLNKNLEKVESGEINRMMVFMPPGYAKSSYASVAFPGWFLGRNPTKSIICASHAKDLAEGFSRKVRNWVGTKEYFQIFPIELAKDSKSVSRWQIIFENDENEKKRGAEYYAVGVESSVTGKRGDGAIIDDPVKGMKEALSDVVKKATWEWYLSDLRTRLKPNAFIIIIQCMTGDTPVLMADGTEKPLRDIRAGDSIATYDNGKINTSRVVRWSNQGTDRVFTIRMKSGITVRANERHPFLVDINGNLVWKKLSQMAIGDEIIRVKKESGQDFCAHTKSVAQQQKQGDIATSTTHECGGQVVRDLHQQTQYTEEILTSSIDTASPRHSTMKWQKSREESALFASSLPVRMYGRTGATSYASIIVTIVKRFAGFCAMTATWLLGMEKQKPYCKPQLGTLSVTHDTVVEIFDSGYEDVFDIQVERTENFIANGLVSHNTRWAEDDLSGAILPETYDGGSGWYTARDGKEKWFVINLPVFARENDILGRAVGEVLWPEWYTREMVENEMAVQTMLNGTQHWNSLYQQLPTTDEGGILKRACWRKWPSQEPPECISIIQSYDTAFEKGEENDFSARTTWGVFMAKGLKEDEKKRPSVILLEYVEERWDYPELKENAIKSAELFNPDVILIEKKGSGHSLIQDLRKTDILPVYGVKVDGTDKIMRANVASIVLSGGSVWYMDRDWAQKLITQCAKFPKAKHDDGVDSAVQAWLYLRKRWWIELPDDNRGESNLAQDNMRPQKSYYGHGQAS